MAFVAPAPCSRPQLSMVTTPLSPCPGEGQRAHGHCLAAAAATCGALRRRWPRPSSALRALGATPQELRGAAIAVLLCGASGCFHTLPVFIDAKLDADESLTGLSHDLLPWSAGALFVGWLIGSVNLRQALAIFSKEQFLAASSLGLILCTLALVILPGLTSGNILVLSGVRFLTGLLLSTGPVGNLYVQECLPPKRRNQAMAFINTAYSIVAILMASCCGAFRGTDWRLEALLWCGLPPLLALLVGFQQPTKLLLSIPGSLTNDPRPEESPSSRSPVMGAAMKLAMCFMACGVGSYGLSYSAGQLSPNLYTNSVLLNAADILGYITVLAADLVGRKAFQCTSFLLAGLALLFCGLLTPGSWQVVACAMVGRIFLNVCFTTIYVALSEVFPPKTHQTVLPICQIAARLGGILAPFCGTQPAIISCPIFGSACVLAALATLSLPDKLEDKDL